MVKIDRAASTREQGAYFRETVPESSRLPVGCGLGGYGAPWPHGLMAWPGNSGENVKGKLRKDLKIVGHSEKKEMRQIAGNCLPGGG